MLFKTSFLIIAALAITGTMLAPSVAADHCQHIDNRRHVDNVAKGVGDPDGCLTDAEIANEGTGNIGGGISLQTVLKTILEILSWIAGIASVVMLILAGFKYVISQGGDGTAQARNTILYAAVGLVIVALAQTIIRFVIGRI